MPVSSTSATLINESPFKGSTTVIAFWHNSMNGKWQVCGAECSHEWTNSGVGDSKKVEERLEFTLLCWH